MLYFLSFVKIYAIYKSDHSVVSCLNSYLFHGSLIETWQKGHSDNVKLFSHSDAATLISGKSKGMPQVPLEWLSSSIRALLHSYSIHQSGIT